MIGRMLFILVLFSPALLQPGCATYMVNDYPEVRPTVQRGAVKHVQLHIHWVKTVDELATAPCHSRIRGKTTYECAMWVVNPDAPDTGSCDLYTLEPADFNDKLRLALMGHGLWHCLDSIHN